WFTDLLPAGNGERYTQDFLLDVFNILFNHIQKTFNGKSKVLDFHHPHQLLEGLEGFTLELSDEPEPLEQILVDCSDTLKYGVKTGHPRYFNQLSSGLDMIGLAGEWLTATANTNMFTFEIAPLFIIMEELIIKKMQELIGWREREMDGIFSPGGTISNLYSVLVARYKFFPIVKTKGMAALPRIVLFTSEHSHYSFEKTSAVLGIGTENVIAVKCDDRGKMIVSDLEEKILKAKEQGHVPFYVSATAGTTVYGAFDPFSEIADICEKYGLWMHVDMCYASKASYTSFDFWTTERLIFVACLSHVEIAKIYAPNTDQARFLSSTLARLASFGGPCVIIGGCGRQTWERLSPGRTGKLHSILHTSPQSLVHKRRILKLWWYRDPTTLRKIFPSTPSTCWRCNAATGTYLHVWWECDRIRPFWKRVFQLPKNAVYYASFCLLLATSIPLFWKTTTIPPMALWISTMNDIMRMEETLVLDNDTYDKFTVGLAALLLLRHAGYVASYRPKGLLQACNQMCAKYLFQPDKPYDVTYDTGDKTIQCGRHVDIFKLWLMWKAKGTCGFELQINKCLENAEYLYKKLKTLENFELVFPDEVAAKIKARMMEEGTAMVSYQPLKDKPNFF
ncbi:hypothetical protein AB205_0131940, partial [Aquarana catesbeiana]